jgi:hypothetical protein
LRILNAVEYYRRIYVNKQLKNKYFIPLLLQLHVSSLCFHIVTALLTVPFHCHLANEIFSPASSVVNRGFEPRSGQTKDYAIGMCCFSVKHAALNRENKDWLARNLYNVSHWGGMSIRGLLFQWVSTIKI